MTRIQTFVSAAEVEGHELIDRVAIVIDLVRASTVIVEAMASGARSIAPVETIDEAVRIAGRLGRDDTLLCGERRGLPIEGFDLGNSPAEFTPERVSGRRLVMSTTNGTRALLAAQGAEEVLVGALLNRSAVVAEALATGRPVALVCAGAGSRFALDDLLCAGAMVSRILEEREGVELDDASDAALRLVRSTPLTPGVLAGTAAGRALAEIGMEGDLSLCARLDVHPLVPRLVDRTIRIHPPGEGG